MILTSGRQVDGVDAGPDADRHLAMLSSDGSTTEAPRWVSAPGRAKPQATCSACLWRMSLQQTAAYSAFHLPKGLWTLLDLTPNKHALACG